MAPRIVGIDLARGLAVLGMFIAHAIPRPDVGELLVDGRSSILFATLAGVSLGLITGGDRPLPRGRRRTRVLGVLVRAAAIFVIGALLLLLDSEIAIILDYYGIMFVLLIPLLFLPRWLLAVIAGVLAVAMPAYAMTLPFVDESDPGLDGALQDYLFTGYYPALVWLPFLLVGLICARSGLARPATQLAMTGGGVLAAVVGYTVGAVLPGAAATAHSGSTAELVGSGGVAVAVTGVVLWMTAPDRGAFGRVIRTATSPLAAVGSLALSVYVLQIIVLAMAVALRAEGSVDYPGWPLLTVLVFGSLIGAWLWRRFVGRGPLERAIGALSRLPARV
ncbi:MAG: hypothetical protein RI885_901 [Actinomycetota bacterium]